MTHGSKIRDCPYCREEIKVDAIKCKYCGSSIIPERPSHEGICPYCKETIDPKALKCKHCNSNLISATAAEPVEQSTMRGLGDAVARFTNFFGVKPCAGCKQRQERLNALIPFFRVHANLKECPCLLTSNSKHPTDH